MDRQEYEIQKALGLLKLFHFIDWNQKKVYWELDIIIVSTSKNTAEEILNKFLQKMFPRLNIDDFVCISVYPNLIMVNTFIEWKKVIIDHHECYFNWKHTTGFGYN